MSKKALSNAINNGATIKFIRRLEDRVKVLEIENISLEDKIEILNDKFLIKLNHEFGGKVKKIFKKKRRSNSEKRNYFDSKFISIILLNF